MVVVSSQKKIHWNLVCHRINCNDKSKSHFSCNALQESAQGCQEVTRRERLEMTLDPDRELQRIHSIIISHIKRLETLISRLKLIIVQIKRM